ncbi:hypothetical protein [Parahaliea aestuarii]|uniref:Uncharacterized protein n=1 Tax=Parahaliea aestuarii TaxID=1852021 RepID=A0A5C9A1M2_9GAMM|nr:hypothetical protein [Parahaliea aestuarii]TXS94763.1 hypothetical protein FVW59_02295 [Parahaliea aestuarii]
MIAEAEVFDAVRRGYEEFETASPVEIIDYFSAIDDVSVMGHVNHIKGILFEQEYLDDLAMQGVEAEIFEPTNHPVSDIAIFEDGEVIGELQLKATESASYVAAAIEENPDVGFVVTSEVSASMNNDAVIDSGIEEAALEEAVGNTLFEESLNPVNPISVIGWLLGLPF